MSKSINGRLKICADAWPLQGMHKKTSQNALKVEEGLLSYSSHELLEHPPSLFVRDGRIITIHISRSLLHLSTAVAHEANS